MIVLAVLAIGIFVFRFWARMDTMNAAIADLTVRVGALERSRSVAVPAPEACPHRNRRFNRRCQAITAADARQRPSVRRRFGRRRLHRRRPLHVSPNTKRLRCMIASKNGLDHAGCCTSASSLSSLVSRTSRSSRSTTTG
jgi:hypothetical protein